jgi:hypothetical protein
MLQLFKPHPKASQLKSQLPKNNRVKKRLPFKTRKKMLKLQEKDQKPQLMRIHQLQLLEKVLLTSLMQKSQLRPKSQAQRKNK